MSMYDLALGDGHQAARGQILLSFLAYKEGQPLRVGRFRDAWIEQDPADGLRIAVYTRNGGGNRDRSCADEVPHCGQCSGCVMEDLPQHPLYLRDADDSFDSTYATVYFRFPDTIPEDLRGALVEVAVEPVDMAQKWREAIEEVSRVVGEQTR